MKKLSPEKEEFANSIGATHYCVGHYWKGGGLDGAEQCCPFRWDDLDGWILAEDYYDVDDPASDWREYEIDFRDTNEMKHKDFQLAIERLVEYCHNSGVMCDELDTVEQILKEM